MSEAAWLRRTDIPAPRTEKKLLEFFGIPPDGYDQLEANIARKRRRWHSMKSGVSPQGRQRAEAVLRLIHSGSETLLRGASTDEVVGGADQAPVAETLDVTLEDLWSVIDDLLANDEYERALQVARDARRRWPDVARPHAAYAWVVWVGWQAEFFIRTPLLEEAVTEAERALRDAVAEPRSAERLATWDSRIGLLLALERPAKALDAARDAQAALGGLPSQLRVHRAEALVLTGRPDDGMVEAIQLRRLHRVRVAAPPQPRPLPARLADLRQGTQGRRRGLEPHRPDRVREIGPPGHRKQAAMEQVTHACMTDGCQRQGQATFSRWCQACGLPNEAGSSAGGAQSGQPPWSADPVGPAARAASSPVPADGHGSGAVAITVVDRLARQGGRAGRDRDDHPGRAGARHRGRAHPRLRQDRPRQREEPLLPGPPHQRGDLAVRRRHQRRPAVHRRPEHAAPGGRRHLGHGHHRDRRHPAERTRLRLHPDLRRLHHGNQ
jgi:hypothetical protein